MLGSIFGSDSLFVCFFVCLFEGFGGFLWFFLLSVSHSHHWIPLGCHCSYRFVSLHKAMAKTSSYTLNEKFVPTELVPCTFLLIKGRKTSPLFLQHFKVKIHIDKNDAAEVRNIHRDYTGK